MIQRAERHPLPLPPGPGSPANTLSPVHREDPPSTRKGPSSTQMIQRDRKLDYNSSSRAQGLLLSYLKTLQKAGMEEQQLAADSSQPFRR